MDEFREIASFGVLDAPVSDEDIKNYAEITKKNCGYSDEEYDRLMSMSDADFDKWLAEPSSSNQTTG